MRSVKLLFYLSRLSQALATRLGRWLPPDGAKSQVGLQPSALSSGWFTAYVYSSPAQFFSDGIRRPRSNGCSVRCFFYLHFSSPGPLKFPFSYLVLQLFSLRRRITPIQNRSRLGNEATSYQRHPLIFPITNMVKFDRFLLGSAPKSC